MNSDVLCSPNAISLHTKSKQERKNIYEELKLTINKGILGRKKNVEEKLFSWLQDMILSIYWNIEGLLWNFSSSFGLALSLFLSASSFSFANCRFKWLLLLLFLSFASLPPMTMNERYLSGCLSVFGTRQTACLLARLLRYQFIRSLLKTTGCHDNWLSSVDAAVAVCWRWVFGDALRKSRKRDPNTLT